MVDDARSERLRLEHARRWRFRQLDGPHIDEETVVERRGDGERSRPARPAVPGAARGAAELAVLRLVAASLSTDGWAAEPPVLDGELEPALVLADPLDVAGVELGVAASTATHAATGASRTFAPSRHFAVSNPDRWRPRWVPSAPRRAPERAAPGCGR